MLSLLTIIMMAASVSEATRTSAATRYWLCCQKSDEWKRAT